MDFLPHFKLAKVYLEFSTRESQFYSHQKGLKFYPYISIRVLQANKKMKTGEKNPVADSEEKSEILVCFSLERVPPQLFFTYVTIQENTNVLDDDD